MFKILVNTVLLVFAINSYAHSTQPAECPQVATLKGSGFKVGRKFDGRPNYIAYSTGSFQTNDQWIFGTEVPGASSADDALSKANAILPGLNYLFGPAQTDDKKYWICLYQSGEQMAVTATPVPDLPSLLNMVRLK